MVRSGTILAVAFLSLAPFGFTAIAQEAVPAFVSAAINDSGRPAAEKETDGVRQPADTISFSTMKPGDRVADVLPGRGYYTRIFSKVVGAQGRVYSVVPTENLERRATSADGVNAIAAEAAYSNVSVVSPSRTAITTPEQIDVAWTSDNYHDLRNGGGVETTTPFNASVFNLLKPGGVFLVIDHQAADGATDEEKRETHRIDRDTIVSEVTAAGFVLDAESDTLLRTDDDMTAHSSFASSQIVLRFRKPQ
jgi:predicted methyltransferase